MNMKDTKIKRYIELYVPVTTCTLHCHYCYIFHQGLFRNKLPEFRYGPDVLRKAFSRERLGGVCLINMCGGGETLLPPQITSYIRVLLENGHFVSVVTNATVTARVNEISQFPPQLLERLYFKFSYHYLELKKMELFDLFFSNIRRLRDAGCSFTLEVTPNDESIPYIEDMKRLAIQELGATCHVTIARNDVAPQRDKPILTNLPHAEFYRIWDSFDSDMIRFKRTIFGERRKEFCYAGIWSFVVDLGTGLMTQCYGTRRKWQIFDDPEKPLPELPVGYGCPMPHCYNGHAFLTLGVIPDINTITYAQIRNRRCVDGTEWLKPKVKAFFSGKLKDANQQYPWWRKLWHRLRYRGRM